MGGFRRTGRLKIVAAAAAIAALAGLFLALGPPKLLARSESVSFCAACHVMEAQHAAFLHSGAHRRNRCVDCHLPNDHWIPHYVWKSIDGMKDVIVFYSGRVPERIELSGHGARAVQANCVRCHETLVSQISVSRNCWECHRRITHAGAGSMMTLPPAPGRM